MGDRLYKKNGGTVWYGYYYAADGKRRIVCTKQQDRAAARAVLRQLEREEQTSLGPSAAAQGGPTVADVLNDFIDKGCMDVAAATTSMYTQKAGHLLRLLGGEPIGSLTLDRVQAYITERLEEGGAKESVRKELVTLRRALMLAHDRKLLAVDPRGLIPRFRVPYVPRDRYLPEQEFEWLLAALKPERRLWLLCAVYSGGRLSEVEGIRWDGIDWQRGLMLLPGTKTMKARRWVPLHPQMRAVLETIDTDKRVGTIVEPWGNVRRDLAVAVNAVNARRAMEAAQRGEKPPAPMAHVSPNDLRRTFASWLKQRGVDSMVVAKLLGHTTSRMVELVYGHLNDASKIAAVGQLPSVAMPEVTAKADRPARHKRWRRHGGAVVPLRPAQETRAEGGAGAAPGSKWVAEPLLPVRREQRLRRQPRQDPSQVAVPRDGVEPPTRGFSVRCSTS